MWKEKDATNEDRTIVYQDLGHESNKTNHEHCVIGL